MICFVYRSERKTGAYLYLSREKTWEDLPEELQQLLGECTQVLQLNLAKRDKLASEDIQLVRDNLQNQGFHLQLPPRAQTQVISYGD